MTDTQETTTTATVVTVAPGDLCQLLTNALVFAAKERTRPTLCAVHITVADGSLIAESTESHVLLRQEIAVHHDGAGSFLVPREAVEAAAKMLKGYKCGPDHRVVVRFTERDVTLETVDQSGTWRVMAGYDFPNTAALWPKDDPSPVSGIAMGGAMLAKVAKLSGDVDTIRWSFWTELKPAMFTIGTTIRGLVMPVRPV